MLKRKLTISDYLLIAVNLIPVYGVWFEEWDAKMVFLVYCLETVIIGMANVLKMAIVTMLVSPKDKWVANGKAQMVSGLFFILFFILHYGIFVFVQTQIFLGVSGIGSYKNIPAVLGEQGKLLLAIFIAYYTLQTFFSFFNSGQYKSISLMKLMFQPYIRIFIQQIIVITGSMFLVFGADKIFILIFAVVKIFAELFINFDRFLDKAEEKGWNQQEEEK
jgi:hypothetical protein